MSAVFRTVLIVMVLMLAQWIRPLPATASFGENKATNATIAALTLQPPSVLNKSPFGSGIDCDVALSWSLPEAGAPTSWVIQRYEGSTPSGDAMTVAGTSTSAIDDTIELRVAYTWKIHGVAGTQWKSATTTSAPETVNPSCK